MVGGSWKKAWSVFLLWSKSQNLTIEFILCDNVYQEFMLKMHLQHTTVHLLLCNNAFGRLGRVSVRMGHVLSIALLYSPPQGCCVTAPGSETAVLHARRLCPTYSLWRAFCWYSTTVDKCRGYSTQTGSTSPLWCFGVQLLTGIWGKKKKKKRTTMWKNSNWCRPVAAVSPWGFHMGFRFTLLY